jgi:hypothetical protein
MVVNTFKVDRVECVDLAQKIFLETSGLDKSGGKFERMREDAFAMRNLIENKIEIRAAYVHYKDVEICGSKAFIGGERFNCKAFEQIDKDSVEGAYIYALSVGDFSFPEEALTNQLYAYMWGSAFADAVRLLLKRDLEKTSKLSDSFGPGFYGMNVSEMEKLARLINFDHLNLELRNKQVILPLKSCAGLYFCVNDEYKKLHSACENCRGTHLNCKLCQIGELE